MSVAHGESSELAFRLLCRRYNTHLTFAPMMNSYLLVNDKSYRENILKTDPDDFPLVAQIAGHKPELFAEAGRILSDHASVIDINFGCPQRIAKRGHYGAYLLNDIQLMQRLVSALASGIRGKATLLSCKNTSKKTAASTI